MLQVSGLQLAYGPRVLYADASFSLSAGSRAGLVGANGSGKTTLLRVLTGEDCGQTGSIEAPAGSSLGYLPQDGIVPGPRSLIEECRGAFPEVVELQRRLGALETTLASSSPEEAPALLSSIAEVEDELAHCEASRIDARIQRVLAGLGFLAEDADRPAREFSGGWRMRIALARLLVRQPDLLLLDEPTNHLDLDTQEWLEKLLSNYPGTLILISHDRGLLDRITNHTLHLHAGKITSYPGNYSFFEESAAARQEQLRKAADKQSREIRRTEEFIERFRYKATKARQVQSRIKALDRIERIDTGPEGPPEISFHFGKPPRGPLKLVQAEGLAKAYGNLQVFRDLTFAITRGEKIAVVGRNGKGKSTLARLVAGVEPPSGGTLIRGEGTRAAWFAQHQAEELDPAMTVEACARAALEGSQAGLDVRSLLGAFLFTGDSVEKPVRVLSGGEKNRLALVRMLLKPANLLILDEPTNHLDIASRTRLQAALMEYEGAALIVAHDRDFLDPVVDRVFAFEPDGFHDFPGDVSSWLHHREQVAPPPPSASSPQRKPARPTMTESGETPRERRQREAAERAKAAPIRRKVAAIEAQIEEHEARIAAHESAMLDPAFFNGSEAMAAAMAEYDSAKRRLTRLMAEWEDLASRLEGE